MPLVVVNRRPSEDSSALGCYRGCRSDDPAMYWVWLDFGVHFEVFGNCLRVFGGMSEVFFCYMRAR